MCAGFLRCLSDYYRHHQLTTLPVSLLTSGYFSPSVDRRTTRLERRHPDSHTEPRESAIGFSTALVIPRRRYPWIPFTFLRASSNPPDSRGSRPSALPAPLNPLLPATSQNSTTHRTPSIPTSPRRELIPPCAPPLSSPTLPPPVPSATSSHLRATTRGCCERLPPSSHR